MKKNDYFIIFLLLIANIFLFPFQASGSQNGNVDKSIKVYDYAELFNSTQKRKLSEMAKSISDNQKFDVIIVTTNDVNFKSSMEYADDFYDYYGFGYDNKHSGVILLINMDDREVWISTAGDGIKAFTDQDIEKTLDTVYDYLSDGDFYNAGIAFLNKSNKEITNWKTDMQNEQKKLEAASKPVIPVPKVDPNIKVYDYAKLFDDTQKEKLLETIKSIVDKQKFDIAIVTTNDTGGKSSMEYADEFYDSNGFGFDSGHSGIILLINMQEQEVWISTSGDAIKAFTDNDIKNILDSLQESLKNKDFYNVGTIFLNKTEQEITDWKIVVAKEKERLEYLAKPMRERHSLFDLIGFSPFMGIGGGVFVSLICLLISTLGKKSAYTSLAPTAYVNDNGFILSEREDHFIGSNVFRTPIQRTNRSGSSNSGFGGGSSSGRTHGGGGSSSGRGSSSSHSSSSGSSHGGGGRKF